MQVFSARVQDGTIIPDEGVELPEGSRVTVIAGEADIPFDLSADDEASLAAAIAGVERGEVVTAEELLRRLTR
jgi:hypothetical protein